MAANGDYNNNNMMTTGHTDDGLMHRGGKHGNGLDDSTVSVLVCTCCQHAPQHSQPHHSAVLAVSSGPAQRSGGMPGPAAVHLTAGKCRESCLLTGCAHAG